MMKTDVCERLGIDLPIILAPMGSAVGPELAAAVSNAGGLGILPLWSADLDTLRASIRKTRSLTSAPLAVNLNLEFPQEERLEACLEEAVPIISFFWRDPGDLVARAKAGGAIVLHTVDDGAAARRAVDAGVDVIVAQGWEAGGHVRGMVATMPLVPAVVDAANGVPVVAAGGIADGRGLAAALALGAGAGWIGTRFLAAEEATIHPRLPHPSACEFRGRHRSSGGPLRRRMARCTSPRPLQLDRRRLGGCGTPPPGRPPRRGRRGRHFAQPGRHSSLPILHAGPGCHRRYRGAFPLGGTGRRPRETGSARRGDRPRDHGRGKCDDRSFGCATEPKRMIGAEVSRSLTSGSCNISTAPTISVLACRTGMLSDPSSARA